MKSGTKKITVSSNNLSDEEREGFHGIFAR